MKQANGFRYGYLLLGGLFLALPSFHTIDLLPDCIALFLIAAALRPIGAGVSVFKDAERAFTKAGYITLLRFPAMAAVIATWTGSSALSPTDAQSRARATVALLVLGFAILESIFLLSAFSRFFSALDYLGEREGIRSAVQMRSGRPTELLRGLTYTFLIARAVLELLPSFSALLSKVPITTGRYALLTVLAASASLLFGGIFLSYLRDQLNLMHADEKCNAYFTKTIAENRESYLLAARAHRFSLSMALGTVAAVFTLDLVIDAVPLLPEFLAGICLLLVLFALPGRTPKKRTATVAAILYSALALLSDLLHFIFLRMHGTYNAVNMNDGAYTLYTVYTASAILSAAAFIFLLFALFRYVSAEHLCLPADAFVSQTKRQEYGRCRTYLAAFTAFGCVSSLFSCVLLFTQTLYELVPANLDKLGTSTVPLPRLPYMGPISILLGLLFILSAYLFFSKLKTLTEGKSLD